MLRGLARNRAYVDATLDVQLTCQAVEPYHWTSSNQRVKQRKAPAGTASPSCSVGWGRGAQTRGEAHFSAHMSAFLELETKNAALTAFCGFQHN